MTTTAPSLLQRQHALRQANQIRSARAQLKRDWKTQGRRAALLELAEVIVNPPVELHTMRIIELLLAVPGYGRKKLRVHLLTLQIGENRTVGQLSPRQRAEIADWALGVAA